MARHDHDGMGFSPRAEAGILPVMRRALPIAGFVSLLVACAVPEPERPVVPRGETAFASPFAEVVVVRVFDIPPGTAILDISLVGPEGRRLAAPDLVRSRSETGFGPVSRPSLGIGVTGGSESGITPSISLGWQAGRSAGAARSDRRVTGRIALPDPAAYRARPDAWRVEVRYRDVTGLDRVLLLPAPPIG